MLKHFSSAAFTNLCKEFSNLFWFSRHSSRYSLTMVINYWTIWIIEQWQPVSITVFYPSFILRLWYPYKIRKLKSQLDNLSCVERCWNHGWGPNSTCLNCLLPDASERRAGSFTAGEETDHLSQQVLADDRGIHSYGRNSNKACKKASTYPNVLC